MSRHFAASDGLRIAYDIADFTDPWTDPAILILLHAAMGSSKRWYAMVPSLCRHLRVIRMDLRGHGESSVPAADQPLSMERLAQDVRELMEHIGCRQAHFVGNSAGGYVAQTLAMQSPERVISLCLFGSTPGLKNSQARSWLPRVERDGLRRFLADTISDRFPRGHDPAHIEWFLNEAAKNDAAYIGRFIELMTTLDWTTELGRIHCPTLLVAGGAETVGHAGAYEVMRDRIPDSKLILYDGLPHNICDIVPERCAADVLAFLRQRCGLPRLRRAVAADVAAIRNLTRTAYAKWVPLIGREPKPMQADYAAAVRDHMIDLLEIEGELVGLVETIRRADHLLIENVAILPTFQRRGYGRRMMAHAERLAASLGYKTIRLYTNQAFAENVALYQKLGYGVDREEQFDCGFVVHMSKPLCCHSREGALARA